MRTNAGDSLRHGVDMMVTSIRILAAAVVACFFFCAPSEVVAQTEGSGEGSGGPSGCIAEWTPANYWWVYSTGQGDTELVECQTADLLEEVHEWCGERGVVVFAVASGNNDAHHSDEYLADTREQNMVAFLTQNGVTAVLSGPGGAAHAGEEEYGVRVWCANGREPLAADGTANSDLEQRVAVLEGQQMPGADSEEIGDSVTEEDLEALGRRVSSLNRRMRALEEEGSGEGANGPTIRLLVRTTFQHRRTANGFGGDLGLIVDLGSATIEGGVSLGAMSPIFEDGSALGQTVGGFANVLFETGETFSFGPGFRYEENMGVLLNGDDKSLYQRFIPGFRFDLRFGEEKDWNTWIDLLYERSIDAGALAPNGAGISAGIGRNIGTWGNLGFMFTAFPEIFRF